MAVNQETVTPGAHPLSQETYPFNK